MTKKMILGTLGGTITMLALASVFFMGILGGMAEQWMQEYGSCLKEMQTIWWIIGSLIFAFFLALLLHKFGVNTFKDGAVAGTWIFFLMTLSYGIMSASTYTAYPWNWLPFDLVGNTITGAVAGGVTGLTFGKVK